MLTLVTGGSRSGKSAFAEGLAQSLELPVLYIATARRGEGEMDQRIERHRQSRPRHWATIEEPRDLKGILRREGLRQDRVLLVDCLTLWLSNLLLEKGGEGSTEELVAAEEAIMKDIVELVVTIKDLPAPIILVTNEVGFGLVPPYPMGRVFRDLAGRANQALAAQASHAALVVAGIPLWLKGGWA